ncbi:MAG TPA: SAM-dependent methyltransferase [Thermoplasmata archaeon]|nr:SAM-dependent methyltransferase [Thermoplasmata archaeon]
MATAELGLAFGLLAGALALAYFVFASFAFGAGYQPTPRRAVETMLRLAEVGPEDTVYDLGAGTGAIVFRAARVYRARTLAVEVEPIRVGILHLRRRTGPFADRIRIRWGNLFSLDFREATVVTAFLWPGAMERLRPKFEAELRSGARVVSHHHPVPGWTATAVDAATHVYFYRWPEASAGAAPTGGT